MSATFTLEEVLAATGGELIALGGRVRFPGVTTDTRAIAPGELFVAVRGDTHDGHAFVGDALARGAGAVLVERGRLETPVAGGVIAVRDTLEALGDLAAWHRRRRRPRVVAITGSNGKTTTKELLVGICATALGPGAVLHTRGTQNNLVGLPLTLLRLGDEAIAIVEAGMNGPGEIWRLVEIASPDVGVVTCVAPAHLEGLGSLHAIAEAKGEMYRRLRPSATAVVNADDPQVVALARLHPGPTLRFGCGEGSIDVRAERIEDRGLDGVGFTVAAGGRSVATRLEVPGRHNVTNALAAAAAARALGIDVEAIGEGIAAFRAPSMRMQVARLASGVTVVNDAYNANPASMAAALRTIAASAAGRRIAVLGDMRELGAAADALHREVGRAAAAAHLDALFVLGEHAAALRDGALAAGMPAARITLADTHAGLGAALAAFCRADDLVLLKGSRGSAMEGVLAYLDPGRAP